MPTSTHYEKTKEKNLNDNNNGAIFALYKLK